MLTRILARWALFVARRCGHEPATSEPHPLRIAVEVLALVGGGGNSSAASQTSTATTCLSCCNGPKRALSVHIHAKFALDDYKMAFEAIARRQSLGKTLLAIREA